MFAGKVTTESMSFLDFFKMESILFNEINNDFKQIRICYKGKENFDKNQNKNTANKKIALKRCINESYNGFLFANSTDVTQYNVIDFF